MNIYHGIAALVTLLGGFFLLLKALKGKYLKPDRIVFLLFSLFILIWAFLAFATLCLSPHSVVSLFYIDMARKLVSGSLLGMGLSMLIYGTWKRL